MGMLRWVLGASLKDKTGNEVIRNALEEGCIGDKIREARLMAIFKVTFFVNHSYSFHTP